MPVARYWRARLLLVHPKTSPLLGELRRTRLGEVQEGLPPAGVWGFPTKISPFYPQGKEIEKGGAKNGIWNVYKAITV
ncbi:hypothetical protein KSC_053950 [Ktedonobacter sp. SOSP1-52]|nr:hypothetical protein KSC_053950 [Ktedonobacter sp. SOSP1-52]